MEEERFEYLESWLKEHDTMSLSERVRRLDWLVNEYGDDHSMILFGYTPGLIFEEARLAFLNGLYASCIIISEAIIEQSFAGLFYVSGRDEVKDYGYCGVIEMACAEKWISDEEHRMLLDINRRRNSLVHFRSPADKRHLIRQTLAREMDYETLVEQDAMSILAVLFRLTARGPFGAGRM